jgi:hypothetical protein
VTAATLLIGLLAAIDPAEMAQRAREFCAAVSASGGDSGVCPLTGRHNFRDALAAILADEHLAARIDEILVAPSHGQAFVRYDASRPPNVSGSVPPPPPHPQQPTAPDKRTSCVFVAPNFVRTPLSVSVTIYSDVIRAIAAVIAKLESDQ